MFKTNPFICLIDDDEDDLEVMSASLKLHGIRIRSFKSGQNALAYFDHASLLAEMPSLIILDYNMPLMNGMETHTGIK